VDLDSLHLHGLRAGYGVWRRSPLPQQLLRQRQIAHCGQGGVTLRAQIHEHHDAGFVDVEILVLDDRAHLFGRLRAHRGARAPRCACAANGRDVTLPDGRRLFITSQGTGAPEQ
jgi:hypothetical protein